MALLSIPSAAAPTIGALVTFAIYNTNDLADVDEDAVNRPERASFVVERYREIAVLATAAGVAGLTIAWVAGGWIAVGVAAFPLATGVLYSVPCVPLVSRRLKDVLGVNTVLVATSWAVPTTFVPVAVAGGVSLASALPVLALLLLLTAASVETFNVRDVAGDRAAGVATLPVAFGVARTRWILLATYGATAALLVATWPLLDRPPALLAGLLALLAVSMTTTALLGTDADEELVCLAKDCEYLAMAGLALVAI